MPRKKSGETPDILATTTSIRATPETIKRLRMFALSKDADLADVVYEAIYDKWSGLVEGLPVPEKRVVLDK